MPLRIPSFVPGAQGVARSAVVPNLSEPLETPCTTKAVTSPSLSLAFEAASRVAKPISAVLSSSLLTTPGVRLEKAGASFTGVTEKLPEAIALEARPLSLTCQAIVRLVLVAVGVSLLLA